MPLYRSVDKSRLDEFHEYLRTADGSCSAKNIADVDELVADRAEIGPGTTVLDVACGKRQRDPAGGPGRGSGDRLLSIVRL